ncbi:hypothetical protein L1887_42068 [Cichorium endivia]|nr:hypothetical protein L1887_42068 [Cichorium endivia]
MSRAQPLSAFRLNYASSSKSKAHDIPDPIGYVEEAVTKVSPTSAALRLYRHQLTFYFGFRGLLEAVEVESACPAGGSVGAQDGQGVGASVLAGKVVADECDHALHERLGRADLQHDGRRHAHHLPTQRHLWNEHSILEVRIAWTESVAAQGAVCGVPAGRHCVGTIQVLEHGPLAYRDQRLVGLETATNITRVLADSLDMPPSSDSVPMRMADMPA